jgi:hypothetical protein
MACVCELGFPYGMLSKHLTGFIVCFFYEVATQLARVDSSPCAHATCMHCSQLLVNVELYWRICLIDDRHDNGDVDTKTSRLSYKSHKGPTLLLYMVMAIFQLEQLNKRLEARALTISGMTQTVI